MKKVLIGVLSVLLVVLIGIGGYIFKIMDSISRAGEFAIEDDWGGDPDDFGISDDAPLEGDTKVINVLLLGSDRRHKNENGRSDSIMIATLDKENGQLKLSSIMRDLYISIPGKQDNRINAAFSFGGPRLAMQTINQNFNLDIQRYVTVDFFGLEGIINSLGGIDMDVKEKELRFINSVIRELNKLDTNNNFSPELTQGGFQTLDGKQTVAYSRIRKVGDGDSERTQRQRRVMVEIFNKVKSVSPLKLPDLVAAMVPYVDTNISLQEVLSLGTSVLGIKDKNIYEYRVPTENSYTPQTIRGMAVYVPDLHKNTQSLHQFLYERAYKDTPSQENTQ